MFLANTVVGIKLRLRERFNACDKGLPELQICAGQPLVFRSTRSVRNIGM